MSQLEKKWRMARKWLLRLLAVLGLLIVLLIALLYWSQYPRYQPSFLARVVVDLEVDGQEVRMERIVECESIELSRDLTQITQRPSTTYIPTAGALGKKLPDGSAVMLWTPYHCWQEAYLDKASDPQKRVRPNAPDYLPFLAWTPDAENPTTLEIYSSPLLLRGGNQRVLVKQVQVFPAPKNSSAAPRDEFEWFTTRRDSFEPKEIPPWRQIGPYYGFAALVLSEDEWRGISPELDAELDSMTEPGMISRKALANGVEARWEAEKVFSARFPPGIRWELLFPNQRRKALGGRNSDHPDSGPILSRGPSGGEWSDRYFPLKMTDELVIVGKDDAQKPFTARLLSRSQWRGWPRTPFYRRGYHIEPDPVHPSKYLYDPETREVFFIRGIAYSGKAHPNDRIVDWFNEHRKTGN